ncbi:hypothetical protein SADUNF_Sadunf19G0008300 [Salix dunnii]|uniref:Uncharacterized protein n=1 Tax=Salix dunnii TaxID=1413687 RepID=A0A835J130_9ROSI|nr:hypothetical protein SADUNF_Sadunf19G0008300 [Salix dunnii]
MQKEEDSNARAQNKVADALRRRPHLLHISTVTVNGFEHITKEYSNDEDFGKIWNELSSPELVWLQSLELQRLHPHLFTTYLRHNLSESSSLGEPAIDANQDANQDQDINAGVEAIEADLINLLLNLMHILPVQPYN